MPAAPRFHAIAGLRVALRCGATLVAVVLLAIATPAATAATPPQHAETRTDTRPGRPYGEREDVMRFAAELAARHPEIEAGWLREQLARSRFVPAVARLVMPAPTDSAKNWAAYRERFIEPQRIAAGLLFWRAHQAWLARAEARWGVPPAIVVGILGVETYYGRVMGDFSTLDALATLSFDFPAGRRDRAPFFREQLEALLLWCRREGRDAQSLRGSYAGALGLPQFMPGSINRYAVDFDGDGHIELSDPAHAADAIGSVANYLASFGWQRGLATHYGVSAPADAGARAQLLAPDIVPSFSAAQFTAQGATLAAEARQHEGPLALVELHNGGAAPSYVAGTSNFYAITRYNASSYYALAVIELGAAIARLAR